MKTQKTLLLILISFVFYTSNHFAIAEEATTEKNQDTVEDESTTARPKISSKKRSEVKNLEEFIPSEEVSADKPISFPIDI